MASPVKDKLSREISQERRSSTQIGTSGEKTVAPYEETGHIRRDISGLNMASLAFNICNSWTALATTFAIAIAAGGTFTVIYGIIVVSVVYFAVALTLAELASVYPTAGGQYHFSSILAPRKLSRVISYICGFAASCSWVFLAGAVTILATQILLSFPAYYSKDYVPQNWHYFLIFQALNITTHVYNLLLLKKTVWIHQVGFMLSLLTFLTVSVTCLVRADKQPSSFVWNNFENNVGWPDGVTFLTGLMTPAVMFLGLDGAMHLAEECFSPERTVPQALISTSVMGSVTGVGFSIAMCYGITDLNELVDTTMPIYGLWRQATRSTAAATVFLVALFIVVLFAINAIVQTASRMTWAFAQDGGLLGGRHLAAIHPTLQVPVWGLIVNSFIVFILGCIYLGSSVAFNAVAGSSIILQMLSFSIPALLLMLRKRSADVLPSGRFIQLPNLVGWIANMTVVIFAVIETIFFNFPPTYPTTGSSMNYASVVLFVTFMFAVLNWFLYARRHYQGPRIVHNA
ncbi:hypothetical protein NW754_007749 [Fusarium falciforme]|nr:hypothetical protein NW754_007749 [Fusarium falciforme]KAJ4177817.1 hypothetical protein NW767_015019 [Fusarium falciforme]